MMSILAPQPIKNGTAVLDDIAIAVKVASGGSGYPSNRNAGLEKALCKGRGTAVSTRMVDKTHAISRGAAANHDMTRRSTILATGQTVPDPMPKSRVGWTVHLLQINNQMIQPDGMARCAPIGDGGSNSYNGASVNDSLLQRGHQRRELKNDRPLRPNPDHRPCGSAAIATGSTADDVGHSDDDNPLASGPDQAITSPSCASGRHDDDVALRRILDSQMVVFDPSRLRESPGPETGSHRHRSRPSRLPMAYGLRRSRRDLDHDMTSTTQKRKT